MAGSGWGTILRMTTWGESHGRGLGVVLDGFPAGLELEEADIQRYLDRRKPGQSRYTTARREGDQVEIWSGVFEGRTTGTPISMLVRNTDQRSADYSAIMDVYRPGHADYTFDEKYGFRDYRGGGRSSGRETIGRVAAGAAAAKLLESLGITVTAYTRSIGPVRIGDGRFDLEEAQRNRLCMPDAAAAGEAERYLERLMAGNDSAGGVVECVIKGLPAGLGEPVFEKLDARLAHAVMSIGAVKGVEIGDGFRAAESTGSENNDGFRAVLDDETETAVPDDETEPAIPNDETEPAVPGGAAAGGFGTAANAGADVSHGESLRTIDTKRRPNRIRKTANHAGGILGGISDGDTVVLRAAFKPTPSIAQPQRTVDRQGRDTEIAIRGRHDPVIVPRAVVVVEAMAAFTAADLLLANMTSRMEYLREIYR